MNEKREKPQRTSQDSSSLGRESNPGHSEHVGVQITIATFSCFTLKEEHKLKI
jgi:hypothetical protein